MLGRIRHGRTIRHYSFFQATLTVKLTSAVPLATTNPVSAENLRPNSISTSPDASPPRPALKSSIIGLRSAVRSRRLRVALPIDPDSVGEASVVPLSRPGGN